MLNFHLTPEQFDLRLKAREFALKEILPVAWYYDGKDTIPMEILEKARAAGFIAADIPTEYGGQGLGLVEAALVTEEIAAAFADTSITAMPPQRPVLIAFSPIQHSRKWPQNSRNCL